MINQNVISPALELLKLGVKSNLESREISRKRLWAYRLLKWGCAVIWWGFLLYWAIKLILS